MIRSLPWTNYTHLFLLHAHTQAKQDCAVPIRGVLANQWNRWNATKSMTMVDAVLQDSSSFSLPHTQTHVLVRPSL